MKTQDISVQTIKMIVAELNKALHFGIIKAGPEKGKHGELDSIEFACVEGCFERAFKVGLNTRFSNIDVIDALTRLVNCKNEKRAHQFAIAFANEVLRLDNHRMVHQFLMRSLRRFSDSTRPQIMTSGVEHLVDYLAERMNRRKVA